MTATSLVIASKLLDLDLLSRLRSDEPSLRVSIVTKIEVLGYHQLKQVEKAFLENFFNAIPVLQLDETVSQKAIELRQRKPMSLADAIIAATALIYDLTLLTDNIKDYAGVSSLKLLSIEQYVSS